MPQFVVCVPATGASSSAPPCADVGGVHYQPVMMEMAAPGSIQFANSNTLFAYALTAVVTCWLLGLGVGVILSVLRK